MQQLLKFIEQNLYIILFAVLQIVCGILIFGLNPYQQASFTHSVATISARGNEMSSSVTDYLDLKHQNQLLQKQVAEQFKNSHLGSVMFLADTFAVRDSSSKLLYDIVPAEVVYNTSFKANNVFVINKGTDQGVTKNMGVVSSEGVAGIVLKSNNNYSTCMSLLNTNMTVIPTINGNEYYTKLEWKNSAPNTMSIKGINKLEKIDKGDLVQTGQSSLLFPKGIPIGVVDSLETDSNSQYFKTSITTATNFRNLEYVYVIINKDADQISDLLEE